MVPLHGPQSRCLWLELKAHFVPVRQTALAHSKSLRQSLLRIGHKTVCPEPMACRNSHRTFSEAPFPYLMSPNDNARNPQITISAITTATFNTMKPISRLQPILPATAVM
jgi:hypothetical protein